ncbi:uncharacterized protein LOC132754682 [Ruditapes philippinarum]|uniref:uncharacterized protein LOC132754682 n=1 Tax=Ruditapes philippinarum TaxID=129788 RepID=UPI00295AAA8F|nr:uncharacterized protein LOC132754682 [Ruditapes philippinarum]
MDVNLILLFVYIIFYNIIFANGIKIQTAIFQVPRNHPDIRKCAMEILHINNVTGARISDQTGKCEKLTDEYTTVAPGYEYIEKVYFKIEFQPAISTDLINPIDRKVNLLYLPLTMWSRLDFSFVRKPPSQ